MPASDMGHRDLQLLLDACMYRVTPEQRAHLMFEVPAAYNAYCGRNVVAVMTTSDGQILERPRKLWNAS